MTKYLVSYNAPSNFGYDTSRKTINDKNKAIALGKKWAKEMKTEETEEGTFVKVEELETGVTIKSWQMTDEGVQED